MSMVVSQLICKILHQDVYKVRVRFTYDFQATDFVDRIQLVEKSDGQGEERAMRG